MIPRVSVHLKRTPRNQPVPGLCGRGGVKQSGRARHEPLKINNMNTVFVKVPVIERLPPRVTPEEAFANKWSLVPHFTHGVPVCVKKGNGREEMTTLYYNDFIGVWLRPEDGSPSDMGEIQWWLEEISVEEFIRREIEEPYKIEPI